MTEEESIQKALAKKTKKQKIESIIEALKQELCDNCIREQTVFYYCPRCGYVCHQYPKINMCEYCGTKFEVENNG